MEMEAVCQDSGTARIQATRCLPGAGLGCIAVLILNLPAILPAQHIALTEYPVPNSSPQGIAAGPDGALWFTERSADKIGRITIGGVVTEYPLPSNEGPLGITVGPDGALWFTETAGAIGRITTAGIVTEYQLRDAEAFPWSITAGSDGALWFTQNSNPSDYHGAIGRISVAGAVTVYPVPGTRPLLIDITSGPDGALWFTENNANKIGRITTAGVITEYPVPAPQEEPWGITSGPDGALWFTESGIGAQIGRVTTAGSFTSYPILSGTEAVEITEGPDGALWFTESFGLSGFPEYIGRITTSGVITEYPLPTSTYSDPYGIGAGPDGALWFAEIAANQIGRVPACGLGFSASFADSTLTMTFDLGITTPATFNIFLRNSTDPVARLYSRAIPAVVPPQAFAMKWTAFPYQGTVALEPVLSASPGQAFCSESQAVKTGR